MPYKSPKRYKAYQKKYNQNHKKKMKEYNVIYHAAHAEQSTVRNHHYHIFKSKRFCDRGYKHMPFFNMWNPDKGGSYKEGAKWIIENLGKNQKVLLCISWITPLVLYPET